MNRQTVVKLIQVRNSELRKKYSTGYITEENKTEKAILSAQIKLCEALLKDIDRHSECVCLCCGEESGVVGLDAYCLQCEADNREQHEPWCADDYYGSRPGEY